MEKILEYIKGQVIYALFCSWNISVQNTAPDTAFARGLNLVLQEQCSSNRLEAY